MILKVNDRFKNRQVAYFTDVNVDLKYDAFASTFQLSYLFDPNNTEQKEFSCVSHYHICTLFHDNGELILTGFILSIKFIDKSVKTLVAISGYSLPGVLEDCDIPPIIPAKFASGTPTPYSLQYFGLSLKEIVESLIKPFGIKAVIENSVAADMAVPYEETEAKETQSIKSFLSELASQKNIIISHNERGNLVFKRPSSLQKPVFDFTPGIISGVKMELGFNGQSVHSQITVMKQSDVEEQGIASQETIFNPYVTTVFRPKVHKLTQKSDKGTDADSSARNIRAKELRSLSLMIETDRWVFNERVIRPGNLITVLNPNVYCYKKTTWFVDNIGLKSDERSQTSVLNCCIPEAITGEEPKNIFAGINIHPTV